jgi:hypothetical protein
MLSDLIVFLLLSLGLRWFIFKHSLLHPVRVWLENSKAQSFFSKLFQCPYCQTFEASVIVYLILMPFNVYVGFLAGLFNGYVAIAIEYLIESQIDKFEERNNSTDL